MRKLAWIVGAAAVIVVVAAGWHVVCAQQPGPPPGQVTIGGKVANVELATLTGEKAQLYNYAGKNGTLVLFIATRCPISLDYDTRMAEIARDYTARGFTIIGINSNRTEPAEEVAKHAQEKGLGFTVLKDPDNRVADYLGAAFTPEAYLFDRDWVLRYHGRIDDSRNPANITSRDLRAALDAMEAGKAVPVAETKAFGCTIKRVPGKS
jgi:peroxiredoxin